MVPAMVAGLRELAGTLGVEVKNLGQESHAQTIRHNSGPEIQISRADELPIKHADTLREILAPGRERAGPGVNLQLAQVLAGPVVELWVGFLLFGDKHGSDLPAILLHGPDQLFEQGRVHGVVHVRVADERGAGRAPAEVPGLIKRLTFVGGQQAAVGMQGTEWGEQLPFPFRRSGFNEEKLALVKPGLGLNLRQFFGHEARVAIATDQH